MMTTLVAYDADFNQIFSIEDEDEDAIAFYVILDEDVDAGV
jgi:hypothetical protein